MNVIILSLIGIAAGISGGFLGVGGGLIMIPAMVYFFNFDQHLAQGTSLAVMLPPIGILAVSRYWVNQNVDLQAALWICAGFFIGSFLGAHVAHWFSGEMMKKVFGVFLIVVSIKMIFGK